jgi:RNA polymerase sigma factor for flagellar operon FliA
MEPKIASFPGAPDAESYYGLVVFQARKVHRRLAASGEIEVELSDLVQQGFVGLLDASSRYDSRKNAGFATFALPRIHGAMVDYLRHLDPLKQREREKVKELDKVKTDLARVLCREPVVQEIAAHMKLSADEVRKREALRVVAISIEDLCHADPEMGELNANDSAVDPSDPEEHAMRAELADDVNNCLENALDDIQRTVLVHRFLDELTLVQLGTLWNTSKDDIWRREKEAKKKMAACLEDKGWEIEDVAALMP